MRIELAYVIGARIRAERQVQGLTIVELAAKASLASTSLNKIELGYKAPRADSLVSVAWALGREPGDFFPETPDILREEYATEIERRRIGTRNGLNPRTVVALRRAGLSRQKIAAALETTEGRVRNILRRNGLNV